jgi:prepilin peptidase CpaA
MPPALISSVVVLIAVAGCVTDIHSRKIPNWLTFGSAVAALIFHTFTGGADGALRAALGWCAGVAVFLPFFLLRGMGAGDVKLLAALGAWLGPVSVLWVALFTSMAGAVLALVVAGAHGYLRTAFQNLWLLGAHWRVMGPRALPAVSLDQKGSPRLAYAIPIFAGTVITLWLK